MKSKHMNLADNQDTFEKNIQNASNPETNIIQVLPSKKLDKVNKLLAKLKPGELEKIKNAL